MANKRGKTIQRGETTHTVVMLTYEELDAIQQKIADGEDEAMVLWLDEKTNIDSDGPYATVDDGTRIMLVQPPFIEGTESVAAAPVEEEAPAKEAKAKTKTKVKAKSVMADPGESELWLVYTGGPMRVSHPFPGLGMKTFQPMGRSAMPVDEMMCVALKLRTWTSFEVVGPDAVKGLELVR